MTTIDNQRFKCAFQWPAVLGAFSPRCCLPRGYLQALINREDSVYLFTLLWLVNCITWFNTLLDMLWGKDFSPFLFSTIQYRLHFALAIWVTFVQTDISFPSLKRWVEMWCGIKGINCPQWAVCVCMWW